MQVKAFAFDKKTFRVTDSQVHYAISIDHIKFMKMNKEDNSVVVDLSDSTIHLKCKDFGQATKILKTFGECLEGTL